MSEEGIIVNNEDLFNKLLLNHSILIRLSGTSHLFTAVAIVSATPS